MRDLDTTDGSRDAAELRVRRIWHAASLDGDTPWVVVATAPRVPAKAESAVEPGRLIALVRGEAASWPAPIPLASEPPLVLEDRMVFSPSATSPEPGGRYRAEFHPDGSAVIAVAVGQRRTQPHDAVWAIGEGAFAWIAIAALRLAAAYADRIVALDELRAEATIEAARGEAAAPLEMWNRDAGGYGPVGRRRADVAPAGRDLTPSACLSGDLTGIAHPLIAGVLQQFGLPGDRHVDPSGVLRRASFAGFEQNIRDWADAIGVASQP